MKQSTFFERNKELILGIFMIAFATVYLVTAGRIETGAAVRVDSKIFPYMLGALIACIGLAQIRDGLIIRNAIVKANREHGTPAIAVSAAELQRIYPVAGIFVLIVLYIFALPWLGFVIDTSVCLFLQIMLLTAKHKRRPIFTIIISIALSVLLYVAFRKGLDLSLPEGLLAGII